MLRITLGGPGADGFSSGGRDQGLPIFLPHPGQSEEQLRAETTARAGAVE